jgi:pimeloyl-ACP methyl ester carboxylesterase
MIGTSFEDTRTAKVNGTTLAYREQGEGTPVVFVHGAISDLRTWNQQVPSIGASHRAITYSRRYARPNDDIDPGVLDKMLSHVDDLASFVQAIDAAPAHLVGNSMGGFISLLTAIRYPEAVRSLVLGEPPITSLLGLSSPPSFFEILSLIVRHPKIVPALAAGVARAMLQVDKAIQRGDYETAVEVFGSAVLGKEQYRRLPESRRQQMRDNVSTLRGKIVGLGFPSVSEDDVRGVTIPTLLITGAQSPGTAFLLTDRLEDLLPNVERVNIPDASHLMHEENAPAVNAAILDFLGRVGVAGEE